ncbi:hypothetical protein DIPPA_06807 [Diplonema papillatum]|nr:hypothetical protein DIPPA_06807 [Diplonema papillatum]
MASKPWWSCTSAPGGRSGRWLPTCGPSARGPPSSGGPQQKNAQPPSPKSGPPLEEKKGGAAPARPRAGTFVSSFRQRNSAVCCSAIRCRSRTTSTLALQSPGHVLFLKFPMPLWSDLWHARSFRVMWRGCRKSS